MSNRTIAIENKRLAWVVLRLEVLATKVDQVTGRDLFASRCTGCPDLDAF